MIQLTKDLAMTADKHCRSEKEWLIEHISRLLDKSGVRELNLILCFVQGLVEG